LNGTKRTEGNATFISYQYAQRYEKSEPPLDDDEDKTVPRESRPGYPDVQAFIEWVTKKHETVYWDHSETWTNELRERLSKGMKAKQSLRNVDLLAVTSRPHRTFGHVYDLDLEVYTDIPDSVASSLQAGSKAENKQTPSGSTA